jgi:hypothetical protein
MFYHTRLSLYQLFAIQYSFRILFKMPPKSMLLYLHTQQWHGMMYDIRIAYRIVLHCTENATVFFCRLGLG